MPVLLQEEIFSQSIKELIFSKINSNQLTVTDIAKTLTYDFSHDAFTVAIINNATDNSLKYQRDLIPM